MADKLLRVRGWDEHYENNRTRKMKNTAWVPIPNKLDNEGYVELVTHPNGAAHLGAWVVTLQVASRCHPRGTLVRRDGHPHAPDSLSLISRIPMGIFAEALPRLVSLGWLEEIEIAHLSAPKAHPSDVEVTVPAHPTDEERTERKNRKKEVPAHADAVKHDPMPGWKWFSLQYPAHRLNPDTDCQSWLAVVETSEIENGIREKLPRFLASEDWTEQGGKFVPAAKKFLYDRMWAMEPRVATESTPTRKLPVW